MFELNQEEGTNSCLAKNLGTPVQTMRSNLRQESSHRLNANWY
jgi:hypothetical protein